MPGIGLESRAADFGAVFEDFPKEDLFYGNDSDEDE